MAALYKAYGPLWLIRRKYGRNTSWAADPAGNAALESMGFKTFGFAYGKPTFRWVQTGLHVAEPERLAS